MLSSDNTYIRYKSQYYSPHHGWVTIEVFYPEDKDRMACTKAALLAKDSACKFNARYGCLTRAVKLEHLISIKTYPLAIFAERYQLSQKG